MKTNVLLLLLQLIVFLFFFTSQSRLQDPHATDLPLLSGSKPTSLLSWDGICKIQRKDKARVRILTQSQPAKSWVPIISGRDRLQNPTYVIEAKIGTPPQTMLVAVDNSYDVSWIPSSGCIGCSTTVFNPKISTSFSKLSCDASPCQLQVSDMNCSGVCRFNMGYGNSSLSADLSQDTLSLSTDLISNFTFGAITKATGNSFPAQGLLGLGRGSLSFVSQTQKLYQSIFSFCLPSSGSSNFSGTLRLGPKGQPIRIKTTPLLKSLKRPSLYFVNLQAIRVGKKILPIPPADLAFNSTSGAGTVIDSGTTFSRLVLPAYASVRDEYRRRVLPANFTRLGGFDTCFAKPPALLPTITFMFVRMNMTLPPENFIIESATKNIVCLAMAASPASSVDSVLNVIASMQLQNHRVLFDMLNSRVGVSRENCTSS